MSDYDVVVVGASIAGCTTAIFLGRAGASVALVESHSDPRTFKRMCTHLIQPSASPTIQRLGLSESFQRAGATHNDLNIWTRYGWICAATEDAPSPMREYPTWNLRRETFDPMLRELAATTEGVDLLLGHTVTELVRDGAGSGQGAARITGVVARERNGSEHQLRGKLVVAADGRESTIAKLADEPARQKPHNRFGYFAHYRDTPLVTGDSSQMWLLDPDVAYAFPTDGGLTLLACMPHKDRLPEYRSDPEQAMIRLFESLPEGPRLDPEKRESKLMGKLEMPNLTRRQTRPGLAFVGDAALAADPLWGVGCGWALQSGEWLAESLAGALGNQADVERGLEVYSRRHHKALAAHEKVCSDYSTGRKFNRFERLLYRGAARDPELAGRMALMGGRWITPRQMLTPATLWRMLRVNMSRSKRPLGLRAAQTSTPVTA